MCEEVWSPEAEAGPPRTPPREEGCPCSLLGRVGLGAGALRPPCLPSLPGGAQCGAEGEAQHPPPAPQLDSAGSLPSPAPEESHTAVAHAQPPPQCPLPSEPWPNEDPQRTAAPPQELALGAWPQAARGGRGAGCPAQAPLAASVRPCICSLLETWLWRELQERSAVGGTRPPRRATGRSRPLPWACPPGLEGQGSTCRTHPLAATQGPRGLPL